jgi:hypothetical protein
LFNFAAILLSAFALQCYYGVMVFTSHEDCVLRNGANITARFVTAFRLGFVLTAVDIFNQVFWSISKHFALVQAKSKGHSVEK